MLLKLFVIITYYCFRLKELKAEKEKTIYIGDSEVDLATARNAGLPCISVAWGFRSKEFLEQNKSPAIFSLQNQAYLIQLPF